MSLAGFRLGLPSADPRRSDRIFSNRPQRSVAPGMAVNEFQIELQQASPEMTPEPVLHIAKAPLARQCLTAAIETVSGTKQGQVPKK